ncbi:MAG: hypothetical protein SH868_07950 [Bythopirellula sp.]|nr:hypothetical protein [Bythopirellula sp.]
MRSVVIPAQAGIQDASTLDSRLRGNDVNRGASTVVVSLDAGSAFFYFSPA